MTNDVDTWCTDDVDTWSTDDVYTSFITDVDISLANDDVALLMPINDINDGTTSMTWIENKMKEF